MNIEIHDGATHGMDDYVYTAWCSLPDTPRGEYDEEIDLIVRNGRSRPGVTALKRRAQEELDANYDPGMKVRKITRVW
jgi:hypothetical protein